MNVTADHIAVAIVTACRFTGENPIAVGRGVRGCSARHYALEALWSFLPLTEKCALARMVGYNPVHTSYSALAYAKKSAWWDERIVDEVELALMNGFPPPPITRRQIRNVDRTASLMGDPGPQRLAARPA